MKAGPSSETRGRVPFTSMVPSISHAPRSPHTGRTGNGCSRVTVTHEQPFRSTRDPRRARRPDAPSHHRDARYRRAPGRRARGAAPHRAAGRQQAPARAGGRRRGRAHERRDPQPLRLGARWPRGRAGVADRDLGRRVVLLRAAPRERSSIMTIPPIVRQVVVPASAPVAYAAWTRQIGDWWPLERHSVFKHDNTVAFVDDEIVETSSTGETTTWGTLLAAEPPSSLTFTWHPGHGPDRASTVAVDFVPIADDRTLVRLTHTGWEVFAEPLAAREEYRGGWIGVLDKFRTAMPATPEADQDVWLLLESAPGLAAGESVFAHPLFAEHLVFIDKLKADGVLVAAG